MPHRARIKSFKVKSVPASEKVVYFPSCINQRMGPAKGDPVQRPLVDETVELLGKAGYEVVFPKNLKNLKCLRNPNWTTNCASSPLKTKTPGFLPTLSTMPESTSLLGATLLTNLNMMVLFVMATI
jgi:hypothetical protein